MVTIEGGANGGELVAKPAIDPKAFETTKPLRHDEIFLYREQGQEEYRYKLTVIDRSKLLPTDHLNHVTAVVLIPAGRESEYVFSSYRGLQSLATSAACARLIAVAFGRHHTFDSQQAVQEELTFVVQVLSQQGIFLPPAIYKRNSKNLAIAFMALQGLGSRDVLAEGDTTLSGRYLVEQVKADGQILRRLYFMENPFVIQSEVMMKSNSEEVTMIDKAHLAFEYHKHACAGIMALALKENEQSPSSGLVIGLGGAGLVNFLQHTLPNNTLHVIELDESVVTVAEQYFGFERGVGKNVVVKIGDGLTIQAESSSEAGIPIAPDGSLNFIAIDVDSKDKTVGMSCPPQAFIQVDYLTRIRSMMDFDGLLVINVSARDPAMFDLVIRNVQSVFETILVCGDDDDEENKEDVNVVVFATCKKMELPPRLQLMEKIRRVLKPVTERDISETLKETVSELEDSLASLTHYGGKISSATTAATKSKKKGGNSKKKKGKKK